MAEHIAIGWMRDLDGFGVEGLAGELARSASDSVLAHTAWYIGKQLEAVKEAGPDSFQKVWESVLAYWRLRVEVLESDPSLHRESTRREADRFTTWLGIGDIEPGKIQKELSYTIRLVTVGIAWEQIAEYLNRHAASHPSSVVTQASALAERWTREPRLVISSSEFGALLKEIVSNGSDADQTLVARLVGELLREGKADLREVLHRD